MHVTVIGYGRGDSEAEAEAEGVTVHCTRQTAEHGVSSSLRDLSERDCGGTFAALQGSAGVKNRS